MGADGLSGFGLQSGIVLAAIIAVVLLADRLGGGAALAQRIAQVALGLALLLTVFSATTAFHPPPAASLADLESMFGSSFGSEEAFTEQWSETAQHDSEVGTIHIGLGILFVLLGLVLFGRLPVISPAFLLGGVLTMLLGAPTQGGGLDQLSGVVGLLGLVPSAFSDAGNTRDVARFVVLLVGVVLLAGAMYLRWEGAPSDDADGAAEASDS